MMTKDTDKEFDLRVRSLMENAEEEVPSRIWNSIDTRLLRRSPSPVWWKWAGVAFAATAAIVLTLILGTNFNQPSIDILPQPETRVSDIPQGISSTVSEGYSEDSISAAPVPQSRSYVAVKTDNQASSEESVQEEPEPMVTSKPERSEERRHERPAISKEQPSDETSIEGKDINWDKYFEDEEKHQSGKKKVALDFNGILGSNDGVSSKSIIPSVGALPGYSNTYSTGISESSASLYGIPLTFGVGARFYLTDRFSLGTGINYSLLTRSFSGDFIKAENGNLIESIKDADIINHIHYIGIPVNAYYDIIQTNLIQFYAFGGATIEKGLGSNFKITGKGVVENYNESVPGVQFSAALGIGIQFNVARSWSLYIDPSARYYFDCKQPVSVRTQKPFMFNFEVGVRYNL